MVGHLGVRHLPGTGSATTGDREVVPRPRVADWRPGTAWFPVTNGHRPPDPH